MNKLLSNEMIASLCLELSLRFNAGITEGDALALVSGEAEYKEIM